MPDTITEVEKDMMEPPFYIQATSTPEDPVSRVLKHGETFGVFDRFGDVKRGGKEGLYHNGTRHLSCSLLRLGRDRPLLLSSTVREENDLLTVDLTNFDVSDDGKVHIPRGTLHIARSKFLWDGGCYERFHFRNYSRMAIQAPCFLFFEADFADIFEVRGTRRARRGRALPPAVERQSLTLSYEGLDRVVRQTRLVFSSPPVSLSGSLARFDVTLPPGAETTWDLIVFCLPESDGPPDSYGEALALATRAFQATRSRLCALDSSNPRFNEWINRTVADLHMMTTETAYGPYPYAGVPWFSTPFGRDGILTALECLWVDPDTARGVLSFLAATQATELIPEQDAEPGKILHEARGGEMAALGEIPFGRYYGSIDATPLYVWLAAEYYDRTGDLPFIRSIWPNIERALAWMDHYGDRDGDGFIEYARRTPNGLVQQGWKDSSDSVFHADGSVAQGPIALCEVQGYAYAARRGAARLASLLDRRELADRLLHQAHTLQERFEAAFWCEELSTYALALDGEKRPCRVRASNAGHCLLAGIVHPRRARRVARTLLDGAGFSGWGIRTVSAGEACYNPMSYHNGSVWPHDNALIAAGFSRYGLTDAALKVFRALFEASLFVDLHRLPELYCGFPRRSGEGPTLYPVACAPQAWAAASVYMLLQACLGLHICGPENRVSFRHPILPDFLQELGITRLRLGNAVVDLVLQRHRDDVGIHVLRREGPVEVLTVK